MTLTPTADQPLVIVGAGPIGLAAAAHAHRRGLPVVVLEAGEVGHAVADWGHVRLFSPWSELVDPVAGELLAGTGWQAPDPQQLPDGAEWVTSYLRPLAGALADAGVDLRTGHRVVGLAREGRDRLVANGRDEVPFAVHVRGPRGHEVLRAAAVIDASGTWGQPGPLGTDGYPAIGETDHAAAISYAVPDVDDRAVRERYAGRHVAVAGAGASAQNTLVALGRLADEAGTRVTWLLRRGETGNAFGGGDNDELAARGALGNRARQVASSDAVATVTGFRTAAVARGADDRLVLTATDGREVTGVDEVVAVTGFRPDLSWLAEVHLDLDGELSSPSRLAPEIHPAHHSCGTVSPHGADLLRQPEQGLYLAGMKSYGRAPSFLALTGFEQVRSIVAEVAGDHASAARVELTLPETGVCGAGPAYDDTAGGCCGAPEPLTVGTAATAR
ncbi:NAD(P)-binding domain-containing protein [Nocardioides panacisoli]|uniref:NAD(P)-binding domain-containing protein n=1 Tax=Nocardioides panacisoli TaxID=627624 RepID=UPI001C628AB9|nr:NAD(P)-binding domain-containing protein [Nocardioides panacisoli]QYJ02811.1 NAD(P)-binding domain-containing protein [Nocardioides panacisoli]